MTDMKVWELFQCIFWGLCVIVPLTVAAVSGRMGQKKEEPEEHLVAIFIATMLQVTALVCAYKAGGK